MNYNFAVDSEDSKDFCFKQDLISVSIIKCTDSSDTYNLFQSQSALNNQIAGCFRILFEETQFQTVTKIEYVANY